MYGSFQTNQSKDRLALGRGFLIIYLILVLILGNISRLGMMDELMLGMIHVGLVLLIRLLKHVLLWILGISRIR